MSSGAHPIGGGSSACTTRQSSRSRRYSNTVFHVATTVAWWTYSPGLITSLTLFLPLWSRLTGLALDDGLTTRRGVLVAHAIGGTSHTAAVARQMFFIGRSSRSQLA